MRYWPLPSLTAVLTFSIRTGLLASTVAPGSTAPDVSLTVPVRATCADARAGTRARPARTNTILRSTDIIPSSQYGVVQASVVTAEHAASGFELARYFRGVGSRGSIQDWQRMRLIQKVGRAGGGGRAVCSYVEQSWPCSLGSLHAGRRLEPGTATSSLRPASSEVDRHVQPDEARRLNR